MTDTYKVLHTTRIGTQFLTKGLVFTLDETQKHLNKRTISPTDIQDIKQALDDGSIVKIEAPQKPSESISESDFGGGGGNGDEGEGDITEVNGIGKTTADQLRNIGINTALELHQRITEEPVQRILKANLPRVTAALEQSY